MRTSRVLALPVVVVVAALPNASGSELYRMSDVFPPPDYANLPLVAPLLSSLGSGEMAEIRIETTGCFSGSTYSLTIVGPPPLRVIVKGRDDATDEEVLPILGDTVLSEADALRIDRVLAYYRVGPRDYSCTTQSDVQARWQTKNGTKTETWHDASCVVADSTLSLSLDSVAHRARRVP